MKMKNTTVRKPTAKQKAFADNYLRTRHITKSVKPVYNAKNDKNAHRIGNYNLKSKAVQNYMAKILNDAGLSDEILSDSLRKIIKSSTTRSSLKKIAPSDGLRGLELAFKLKDRFPANKQQIDKRELKIQLNSKTTKELKSMLDTTSKELLEFKQLISGN